MIQENASFHDPNFSSESFHIQSPGLKQSLPIGYLPPGSANRFQSLRRRCLDNLLKRLCHADVFGKELIEEYLREKYRRNCSVNTLRNFFGVTLSFLTFIQTLGRRQLEEIIRRDLFAYIEHEQDRGMKALTVDVRLRALNCFFRFLIEKDVLRPEILAKRIIIKVPDALPRAIVAEDIRKLLSVIDHIRDRAMILVLLRTGMRIGELLNTLMSEVDLTGRKIDIYEAEKNRVGRVVYLSHDARIALRNWIKVRDPQKQYLFYARGHQTMSYAGARIRFVRYIDKAGLSHKGYTLHCLRHTCASELLNAGMRLECVQQLLGHASIELTRRYARLTDKTREEEYFKAMTIIEGGELDGYHRLDHQLQKVLEKKELLKEHDQELYE